MKILNTWTSTKDKNNYYNENNIVYQNGDYRIFKQFSSSFLHTYKDVAISCLGGENREHIDSLALRERPTGEYSPSHFIYDRAIESLEKGIALNKSNH